MRARSVSRRAVVAAAVAAIAGAALCATDAVAEPVRVAVVGFTGDLSGADLSELAQSVRGSLSRQADPKVLIVVTREEMAAVYTQRGEPCRPDDVACIVDASDAWQGRLFVRGVVRNSADGVIVGATLESVRGVLVATTQTPPSQKYDMGVAVAILVRELLDGERAYRTHNFPPPAEGPVHCKCLAIKSTAIAGELVADDKGLSFDSGANAVAYHWKYTWDRVAKVEAAQHGANPAINLLSSSSDAVTVYFNLGDDRDRCLTDIARKRLAHQR